MKDMMLSFTMHMRKKPTVKYVVILYIITLVPKTLLYEKIYVVEQVLSTHLLSEEEVEAIFPPPPRCKYDITQYKVRLQGGATASLYFDRWPLGDPQSLGRWFVVKKTG